MNPLTWLRKQFTADAYMTSTIRKVEGSGTLGKKERPFNYDAAVKQFQEWVYAAAMMNAQRVATQPLRMYIRTKPGKVEKLWHTRKPSRRRKAYLYGDARQQPSRGVMAKVADWGDDWEEVVEPHPALKLLGTVNPWMNGLELTTLRVLYQELTGNAYIHPVIDRQLSVPGQMWIMPSQWVWVIPDRVEFIKGYVYGQSSDTQKTFLPDEVIHFKRPNPRSLYYGLGKVEAAWGSISLHNSKLEHDTALFDNGARPDYLTIVKSRATPEQLTKLEADLNSKLRGASNAGRGLAVGGDVTVTPLSWPPKDLGDQNSILERIAAVFGVPITKLKANDPNKAGAEQGDVGWLLDTILPLCRADEEVLNANYLPLWNLGDDAALVYDNPVREDTDAELRERQASLAGVPWRTVNDVRAEEGAEPVEGGDELLVSSAVVPLSMTRTFNLGAMGPTGDGAAPSGEPTKPEPTVAPPGQIETSQSTVLNGAQVAAATAIVIAVAAGEIPRDAGLGQLEVLFNLTTEQAGRIMGTAGTSTPTTPNPNPAKDAEQAAQADVAAARPQPAQPKRVRQSDAMFEPHDHGLMVKAFDDAREGESSHPVDGITNVMRAIFARQLQAVKASLLDLKTRKNKRDPAFDRIIKEMEKFEDEIAAGVRVHMDAQLKAGAVAGLERLRRMGLTIDGNPFDVTNPEVEKFLRRYTIKLAGEVNAVTIDRLRTTLAEGVGAGETLPSLVKRIDALGDTVLSPDRAEIIARTESARAYVQGQEEGWKQSGVVEGKRWLLSADACEFCEAAAAEFESNTVELGQAFYKRGSTLTGMDGGVMVLDYSSVDGPPLHPRCRCDCVPVISED